MLLPTPNLEQVCHRFALGEPIRPWRLTDGGLSNELRRLDTTLGSFAVKRMIAGTERADFERNVEASFRIERAALDAGLPMPRPVQPDGSPACLAEIACEDGSSCLVKVHEWVEGAPMNADEATPRAVGELARALGALHQLELTETLPLEAEHRSASWPDIGERAHSASVSWALRFEKVLPAIEALEREHSPDPDGPWVPGHRDLDPKNVLLNPEGGIALLDWDAAGPVHASGEVTSLILDWTGARTGEPNEALAAAVVTNYGRAVGLDASEWVQSQLGWLHFNTGRALGDLGDHEVSRGVDELQFFLEHLPRIARDLGSWLAKWRAL